MLNIYLTIVLAPLVGAVLVGLAGNRLGRQLSHSITILGVAVSTVSAVPCGIVCSLLFRRLRIMCRHQESLAMT